MDLGIAFHLATLKTFFKKKESHMFTYRNGNRESQIDLFLCRRKDN